MRSTQSEGFVLEAIAYDKKFYWKLFFLSWYAFSVTKDDAHNAILSYFLLTTIFYT